MDTSRRPRAGRIDFAQRNDPGRALEPFFQGSTAAVAGALRGTSDGYVHPVFAQGPPSTYQPSDTPTDPYSLATTGGTGRVGCPATTT